MSEISTAEGSVVSMIAGSFSGEPATLAPSSYASEETVKFEFDAAFQTRIAAMAVRSYDFMRHAAHLLKPE